MVVSNICYFHPYLGKISNFTSIFADGLKLETTQRLVCAAEKLCSQMFQP